MVELSLAGALAACRATVDAAKAAISLRDDRLIEEAIRDMKDRLMDVTDRVLALQEKQSTLAERERQLESEIRELKKRNADLDNYEPYRTVRRGVIYRSKVPLTEGQAPIDICANCIAQGVKTFLQPYGADLRCHIHGNVPSDNAPKKIQITQPESPWSRTRW